MSLFTDLLFLHGHVADPQLATTLAARTRPAAAPTPRARSQTMDLFKSLMYLGGRPMHPGHNYDLDEPFEPSFGNRTASSRAFGTPARPLRPAPSRQPRRARGAMADTVQGCCG